MIQGTSVIRSCLSRGAIKYRKAILPLRTKLVVVVVPIQISLTISHTLLIIVFSLMIVIVSVVRSHFAFFLFFEVTSDMLRKERIRKKNRCGRMHHTVVFMRTNGLLLLFLAFKKGNKKGCIVVEQSHHRYTRLSSGTCEPCIIHLHPIVEVAIL